MGHLIDEAAQIVEGYQQGLSLEALARKTGRSTRHVQNVLTSHGVAVRTQRVPLAHITPTWWEQALQNHTISDIARQLNTSPTTITRHLMRHSLWPPQGPPTFATWLAARTRVDGSCLRWKGAAGVFPAASFNGRPAESVRRMVWRHHFLDLDPAVLIAVTDDCPHRRDCVAIAHLDTYSHDQLVARNLDAAVYVHGEAHWNRKLTEEEARAILNSTQPTTALAAQYAVSVSTVKAIRAGRRWRHLQRAQPADAAPASGADRRGARQCRASGQSRIDER